MPNSTGYQPATRPAERRAFFDLLRKEFVAGQRLDDHETRLDTLEGLQRNQKFARMTSGSTSTASTSYVNWPSPQLTVTSFVKTSASTSVIVTLSLSLYCSAAGGFDLAVSLAGSDRQIATYFMNSTGIHEGYSTMAEITGIAAGTYTIGLRLKAFGGSTIQADTNDTYSMQVQELLR